MWTVGWGSTGNGISRGTVWTQEQADSALLSRIEAFAAQVKAAVGLRVNQNQFDALVSLCYNIGPGNLRGSTLIRDVNGGKTIEAADEFLKWDHIGGISNQGLLNRRKAERALFLK